MPKISALADGKRNVVDLTGRRKSFNRKSRHISRFVGLDIFLA